MWSRPFVVLYIAVFVATMGISMVSPLLPVYAEGLGATGMWIGLSFSAFAISQTVIGPFAGGWSDRYGRKPFIIAGLLIYVVAAAGYLTAGSFVQVILFRIFSGTGTALIFAVAHAYIGDMAPERREGRWFGVFATADIVGFGIGPILAGALRAAFGFDSVFIGMGLLMGASALMVTLLLPVRPAQARSRARASGPMRPYAALRDPLVLAVTTVMGLMSLTWGSTFAFLAVRLEHLGVAALFIGVAFAMESLATGISQPACGWLADRFNRRVLVSIGLATSGGMLIGVGLSDTLPVILVLLFGMGIGTALTMVTAGAMQVVAGRRAGMGVVIGLGTAGDGIGIVSGSLIGGLLADAFDLRAPFLFGGVTMIGGIALFLWLTRGVPTTEAEQAVAPEPEPLAEDAGATPP